MISNCDLMAIEATLVERGLTVACIRYLAVEQDAFTEEELARAILTRLCESQAREAAFNWLHEVIWSARRANARIIEDRAQRESAQSYARDLCAPIPLDARMVAEFEKFRDCPTTPGLGNRKSREAFRKWMGKAFQEWFIQWSEVMYATNDERTIAMWEGDWDPRGPMRSEGDRLTRQLCRTIVEYGEKIRLEVTEELLSSVFALGDGRRVTWGNATVEDHKQRVEMLAKYARANVETAAKHQSAINMILESHVTCLRDLAPCT